MHFGGARGSQDRPGYPRGRSCARPAPTPRQRPRPSGPSGKHPPHRGGGKSRLSYPEARSLELDGSRRGPFCRARALLQGVKRARCPCPGAGGRRRCRTHILARARIFQILIQNLSGPRSGENFSKPQWEPACWLCITPIPMVPQPHFPSLRRSAHADRFAKCPPRVLRAAQPRTQPRTRTYAVYPPLRLTALAKF